MKDTIYKGENGQPEINYLKYLMQLYGFTYKTLAVTFDIPQRTLENWVYRNSVPSYIISMMKEILELNLLIIKSHDENFKLDQLGTVLAQAKNIQNS